MPAVERYYRVNTTSKILRPRSRSVRGRREKRRATGLLNNKKKIVNSRSIHVQTNPKILSANSADHDGQQPASENDNESGHENDYKKIIEGDIVQPDYVKTKWDDIVGLKEVKRSLLEACVLPFLMPKLFEEIRRPCRGVLLYGPTGVGKTMLARAVATEYRTTFINLSATLLSQGVGESEKLIRVLFETARRDPLATIFIDEIDAIFPKQACREEADTLTRIKAAFMMELDGLTTNAVESDQQITVLAATNSPWDLEDAVRRRLGKSIYVPLPDLEAREHEYRMCMSKSKKNQVGG